VEIRENTPSQFHMNAKSVGIVKQRAVHADGPFVDDLNCWQRKLSAVFAVQLSLHQMSGQASIASFILR
jgi:hypothetical protein